MSTVRILVTGSREWDDWVGLGRALEAAVDELSDDDNQGKVVIVHGGARGADDYANQWAKANYCEVEVHPYLSEHGKAGGPIRNQRMVDLGADLCLAFPTESSRGTWDCIKRANRAGIAVRIVPARSK